MLDKCFNDVDCYNENPKAFHLEFTEEIKERMRKNHANVKGENNYFYGKEFTGEQNHFFGKKHSEESKRKMSEARKGKPRKVIKVIDTETGHIYNSKNECCRVNNIKYKSFHLQNRFCELKE